GDRVAAKAAAEELGELTDLFESPALHAAKHDAWGRVFLAEGDPDRATQELRTGIRHWQEVGAPFEVARDRMVLASALLALEQDDEAGLELEAARTEFDRLGAVRDAGVAAAALEAAAGQTAPATARQAFVFTDI